MNDKGVMLT